MSKGELGEEPEDGEISKIREKIKNHDDLDGLL